MTAGSVFLARKDWLLPAGILFATAILFIAWAYARGSGRVTVRASCAALKTLGVAALLFCLLEPMWTQERAKPGANLFVIIADNSRSMTLSDAGAGTDRGAALRNALLGEGSAWRGKLGENYKVKNHLADTRLRATEAFAELQFDGLGSALGDALRQSAARYQGQPLAGVLLLTDGNASDLGPGVAPKGLPPIFPVVFGADRSGRDLAITNTAVTLTSFDDAPVGIQADVDAIQFDDEEIIARLFPVAIAEAESPQPAAEQRVKVPKGARKVVFRFQLRPEKQGVAFYRLVVGAAEPKSEMTMANNEAFLTVDRGKGPHRVLYVSGRPNWEYKFLRRAIDGDEQTRMVGLIRIAKREPKFEFRGRAGESSNPLFRGFGNQSKEEVERYDQPVMIRLGTEDEKELAGGFPTSAEELFRYRAVILDDVEAEFFSAAQMSLMQRFVSERGGGLMMLGGTESMDDGGYSRSAIGEMMPVYLGRKTIAEAGTLRLSLTREGWLAPWARLRTNEVDEQKRFSSLPHFSVLNASGAAKPAASVIATVRDEEKEYPALVTQRFGRGRTAAMLIGDFWQSGLGDETRQSDLGKAWRQMIRWLVADVPNEVELKAEAQTDGRTIRLEVRARDGKFEPIENARVGVKIRRAGQGGKEAGVSLQAEPSDWEAGVYVATFIPRESGGYHAEASVLNETGGEGGSAETGWSTNLESNEFRFLTPNRILMEQLARDTGGEVVDANSLDEFAQNLPTRKASVTETIQQPLWHTSGMFLFAVACFITEWGLRRRSGLA